MNNILPVLIAGVMAGVLSYPPTLPASVIALYDYPIVRVALLGAIVWIFKIYPEIGLVLAMSYAILVDDIVKTSESMPYAEGFEAEEISLLPGPADLKQTREIVDSKMINVEMIQDTLRQLQTQIAHLGSR